MSTLESAVAFSLILILLAFMITGPEAVALESYGQAKAGGNELFFMEMDKDLACRNYVDGSVCYDTSPERLCTFLTGISDNFRIVYGAIYDLSQEESNEEN